jgi:hypothetical protein
MAKQLFQPLGFCSARPLGQSVRIIGQDIRGAAGIIFTGPIAGLRNSLSRRMAQHRWTDPATRANRLTAVAGQELSRRHEKLCIMVASKSAELAAG